MKKITEEERKKILEQHKLWLESEGKEGERADFSYTDLSGVDFSGENLKGAIFTGAKLTSTNFQGAKMYGVDIFSPEFKDTDNCFYADILGTTAEADLIFRRKK